MVFTNALNASNNDFEVSSGTLQRANRTLLRQAAASGGYVENLGITYASSTLSVTGADAALSATNPGYVIMPSKASPGLFKKYTVTANQGFIDDTGASEIIGNLFGLFTGVAWGQAMPFFIYAVTNDAEDAIAFMCSRDPSATTSPAAANIGAPDDPVADAQGGFFSFDSLDETLYDSNPCICIGSFRMTMSASDDWTVSALATYDGIGRFQEATMFILPAGVNGAAASTYIKSNAGTEPQFTTSLVRYWIRKSGWVLYSLDLQTCNVVGVGANLIEPILPYAAYQQFNIAAAFYTDSDVSKVYAYRIVTGSALSYMRQMSYVVGGASLGTLQNLAFEAGDGLQMLFEYKAF
jgi:hypothetical protein